jgi:hypothetical protein
MFAAVLITSTAYFPPLAWLLSAVESNAWQWEAHEHYQKGGWRNRCRILTANGPRYLSVPLEGGKHRRMPIRDVRISYHTDWQRVHEQSIRSAYGRAPYFAHYAEEVFTALHQRETYLWDYNHRLLTVCLQVLQLDLTLSTTETFSGAGAGGGGVGSGRPYPQVFEDRFGFVDGLSLLDGLFCLGPAL